MADYLEKTLLG